MRSRSLEQKIFLLILPICLIPPVIFMLLLGLGSRLTFDETIGSELKNRAEYLSSTFDQFLEDKVEALRALAKASPLDPAKLAAAAAAQAGATGLVYLPSASALQPRILLVNPTGKYIRWLTDAYYFKPDIQKKLIIPASGLFEDLELSMPSRIAPLPLFMFVLETAARERLFFIFETSGLVNAFRHGLPQHPGPFFIYSSNGYVPFVFEQADPMLAGSVRDEMTRPQKNGRWFTLHDNKKPYLIAPADSKLMTHARRAAKGQGVVWSILLSYDMENFLGPLAGFIWLSVVIALALTLVILVMGMLAGRNIIRPLLNLKHQAEEIAQGHLDVRASVQSRDEIGDLAEAFNTMASRLRSTYNLLEDRLADNQLRASHINVINEITGAIVQVLSLDSIFEVLVRELGKLTPFDAIWIARLNGDSADLSITHIYPSGLISLFDRSRIPLAGSIHGHVVESRETIHAEIGPQDRTDFFETRIFRSEGFQSYLIAPLPARNRIIGTLTIASTAPDAFDNRLAPIVTSLAGAVAIAIEQTDLFLSISRFAAELEHKVDDRTRELERANRKLLQTEKYFATGRMAGNLAHEINNPLAIIKNYLRLVENGLREAEGGRRRSDINLTHLQVINEEVDRIARMVHQMLNLQRPEERVIQSVDVNALLEGLLTLMNQELARQGIQVVRELAADLPQPLGSPDLIRQVLLNLIRNAQDAMENGGTLSLRTSILTQWSDGAEHQLLRIRIADTGSGIAPENLSQIFDPFFTTKPPDKGTGLGLCVSYSIVSMYRGTIDVESKPGAGTAVIVTLPIEATEEILPENPALPDPTGAAD